MKKDPVVEKLDEILKVLKRIEARPAAQPVPFYFYPPSFYFYPPYSVQPYVPWQQGIVGTLTMITQARDGMNAPGSMPCNTNAQSWNSTTNAHPNITFTGAT